MSNRDPKTLLEMISAGEGAEGPEEGTEVIPKTWLPSAREVEVTDDCKDVLPEERAKAGAYKKPNDPGLFARAVAPIIFTSPSLTIIGPFLGALYFSFGIDISISRSQMVERSPRSSIDWQRLSKVAFGIPE